MKNTLGVSILPRDVGTVKRQSWGASSLTSRFKRLDQAEYVVALAGFFKFYVQRNIYDSYIGTHPYYWVPTHPLLGSGCTQFGSRILGLGQE